MDNLRAVLSIMLSKIPPGEILKESIPYNHMTKDMFVKMASYYIKNYSNDELENMFSYLQTEYEEQADYIRGYPINRVDAHKESFNVFDAILIFSVRILLEIDGEPVCRYDQLLRWRMTSHELDEDVFTTAYLAFKDPSFVNTNRTFLWRPVIRHNNVYLNKVLSQGMADNHFHLKGSAPQFPLSWISMMNCVTKKRFRVLLEQYSSKRLSTIYYTGVDEEHLYTLYLKAALIRCVLFAKLIHADFIILDRPIQENTETIKVIKWWLREKDEILFHRNDIQENITHFRTLYSNRELDYALNGNYRHDNQENINYILSGERWFMYSMFHKVYYKDSELEPYFNMFYAYIVIKEMIRSEMVQTNDNIGFDNFSRFQDRKEDFIENTPFEKHYIRMAIKGTLTSQRILALEARIRPRETAAGNSAYIRKIDGMFKGESEIRNLFYYVFHFIKEKDDPNLLKSNIFYRHYKKRNALKKQAWAIVELREKYPKEAGRLKGIDACSSEIGCRPEVFAQTYRFLRNHITYRERGVDDRQIAQGSAKQLSMTYHVGEDYLDIVDGLRAIDEAVNFLRLDYGSRIGHALALGVNVTDYYASKNNRLLISQQDYLDNLVWLYYKIKLFQLNNYDTLLTYIEQEYNRCFRLIYGNFICDDFFYSVIKEARNYFRDRDHTIIEGYCNSHFYFRISEYYAAWKLRGDNPECYTNGYFKELDDMSKWNQYAVNRDYPKDYRTRYNPECAYLYFLYHFCGKAKEESSKIIEIEISHQMIQCVEDVQQEMRMWLGKRGIGIETNPSSNYFIGSFKRYDSHPISSFYNLGLVENLNYSGVCPQIPVCINTDDQGVFSTYLENEYALLALALEKSKDANGESKYNKMLIYKWIDDIRKMGLNLSFADISVRKGSLEFGNFLVNEQTGDGQTMDRIVKIIDLVGKENILSLLHRSFQDCDT